ncbi:hypothetical protein [Sorangium atrum]|uniref:Secreted protein n=1 Tax=Sorangium atrum TaxID=2995308 RepID=A0ABT5BQ80_9BACT|nr:hypothetical protein [Sorangium aterium]MDC0676242.1 hypothetical protein [Sorangium aterium]
MKTKELGNTLGLVVCAGAALGLFTACSGADVSDEPLEELGTASSEIIAANEVVLHDLSSFSGASQGFGIGRYTLADMAIIGDNTASAITVPVGLRATAFFGDNFGWDVRVFTSDTDLAAAGFDNTISSLVVAHASDPQLDAVTFYENANFSGDSFAFGVGAALLFASPWTAWDLRISSVRVPPGFKVTISDGWIGYPTNTRVLTADANLAPLSFDNKVRSFIIERL